MSEPKPEQWVNCQPGELTKLSAALTFQRRMRVAALAGLIILAAAGTAGAGWLVHSSIWPTSPADSAPCHPVETPCAIVPEQP